MPKPTLRKHTLNLREGDWDFLAARFGPKGIHTSDVVRSIVSRFVDAMQTQGEKENIEVELDL